MEESKQSYSRMRKKEQIHWVISTFIGLLLLSIGLNMIKDYKASVTIMKLYSSFGYMIFLLLTAMAHMVNLVQTHKSHTTCYPSSVYHKDLGLTDGVLAGVFGGFLLFLSQFSLFYALDSPAEPGLIVVMLIGASPLSSLLTLIVFGEKLAVFQVLGMAITFSGSVLFYFNSLSGSSECILFTSASVVLYSLKSLNSRHTEKKGLDSYTSGMLNAVGESILGFFLFFYVLLFEETISEIEISTFFLVINAAVFLAYGQYCLHKGIMTGSTGVVLAIASLHPFVLMAFNLVLNSVFPTLEASLFCLLSLFGVLVMLTGDLAFKKITS